MAGLCRVRSLLVTSHKLLVARRLQAVSTAVQKGGEVEQTTHTGQAFPIDDYRRVRYTDKGKLVNQNFAIDLIREEPIIVCNTRVVASDSGGALGHPKVFLNLDHPEGDTCGYSGRRFVQKKYYNEATMGPCVTYEEYTKHDK